MRLTLDQLAPRRAEGRPTGITSVCSAHPLVLRAALRHGRETGASVLIEATCNQVNHQGGYTGMTPQDFAALVWRIADEEACPSEAVILGGDHLGPNPWRRETADTAMAEAEKMIAAYVSAGFRKLHLDTSMGCAGEPAALDDATTARRAARLASAAEITAHHAGLAPPHYILGTEVPPPGGADHVIETLAPTSPEAAKHTLAIHRDVFAENGLTEALRRVLGIVVQPGVEFGNHNVIRYDRAMATSLSKVLDTEPGLVFEAHSTDYQGERPLSELVADGFAILKVGPELTFVLREALYALDLIAGELVPDYPARSLIAAMEAAMLAAPGNWQSHYPGEPAEQYVLRHYSLSDRIRYYWPEPSAEAAVARLLEALGGRIVPLPLFWQYLPGAAHFADTPLDPQALLLWRITQSLHVYHAACSPGAKEG